MDSGLSLTRAPNDEEKLICPSGQSAQMLHCKASQGKAGARVSSVVASTARQYRAVANAGNDKLETRRTLHSRLMSLGRAVRDRVPTTTDDATGASPVLMLIALVLALLWMMLWAMLRVDSHQASLHLQALQNDPPGVEQSNKAPR